MAGRRAPALNPIRAALIASGLLSIAFALIYGGIVAYDHARGASKRELWDIFFNLDAEAAKDVLSTIGQATPGVLGIAITVVAIIVELASNRYTSQVPRLFFRDRVNWLVFGLFVLASVFPIWVASSYGGGFVPTLGFFVAVALASLAIMILIPYFSYVLTFLQPTNIIEAIRQNVRRAITKEARRAPSSKPESERAHVLRTKSVVSGSVEQIADMALNSILQRDRGLAMGAVMAARGVVFDYFAQKAKLPPSWFKIHKEERDENPDYVTLSEEGVADLETTRVWVEHTVMRQLHLVFVEALNNLRDLNNLIGLFLKDVAIEALARGDLAAHELAVRFLNTSIRSAFGARDVRTAYNIFLQYREVVESLVRQRRQADVETVFGYFKYYGLLFESAGLGFILETVAHDMYRLLRRSLEAGLPNLERLLEVFLEVDRPPDAGASDVHLRGVRKAQSMFAAFAICSGRRDLAERIGRDMRTEPKERLHSIWGELSNTSRVFWEITDRGVNFDYLEPELRPYLDVFFEEILAVTRRSREPSIPPAQA